MDSSASPKLREPAARSSVGPSSSRLPPPTRVRPGADERPTKLLHRLTVVLEHHHPHPPRRGMGRAPGRSNLSLRPHWRQTPRLSGPNLRQRPARPTPRGLGRRRNAPPFAPQLSRNQLLCGAPVHRPPARLVEPRRGQTRAQAGPCPEVSCVRHPEHRGRFRVGNSVVEPFLGEAAAGAADEVAAPRETAHAGGHGETNG